VRQKQVYWVTPVPPTARGWGATGGSRGVGGGPRSPAELPGAVLVDQRLVVSPELLHVGQLLLLGVEVELAAGGRAGQGGGGRLRWGPPRAALGTPWTPPGPPLDPPWPRT